MITRVNQRWRDGRASYRPAGEVIDPRRLVDRPDVAGEDDPSGRRNRLTWIDNLITGSGKDLGSSRHPNYGLPYVQTYLKKVGRRKCEANSIVVAPEMGRRLCEETVLAILGEDAEERFARKVARARERLRETLEDTGAGKHVRRAIKLLGAGSQ
ncbi:MAG: hypothetical protein EPN91_07695 [Salinibacterium sp.]|nr:MAG: hypothetical protein EPN91_07695 [Salinibacterium sp.]